MTYPLEKQHSAARIAGAFAHELCNPLQGVRSLIAALSREASPESGMTRKLERVEAGVNRMAGVLDAFRATYENLPRTVEGVSVVGFMDQLAASLKRRGANISMHYRVSDDTIVQALAPELTKLIAHALVDSATPPVDVSVRVMRQDDYIAVETELESDRSDSVSLFESTTHETLAGLPVLIEEFTHQCSGDAQFCYDDFHLRRIRIMLPIKL